MNLRPLAIILLTVMAAGLAAGESKSALTAEVVVNSTTLDPHLAAMYGGKGDGRNGISRSKGRFPSSSECRICHEQHYREWSASPHAFAQLSPTMEAQSAEISRQFSGTIDNFCVRCHTPVGITLGEPSDMLNRHRDPVSLEGVSCIVCHRIDAKYGKATGQMRVTEGTIFAKVFATTPDNEVDAVIKKGGVATKPEDKGAKIHAKGEFFAPIKTSAFCGQCHEVFNPTNVRLQQTFSQWQSSHAAKQGVRCQDCHLGQNPGRPDGFRTGPAAVMPGRNGYQTKDRPLSSHWFAGPDLPVEHPGVFPHGARDNRGASLKAEDREKLEELLQAVDEGFLAKVSREEWWQFDYIQGWGNDDFEKTVTKDAKFPDAWKDSAKRAAAAEFIRQQRVLIGEYKVVRETLIKNGTAVTKIDIPPRHRVGSSFNFTVTVENLINAHNIPSGFNFFRQLWINAQVISPAGKVVWETGYLDNVNGDLADGFNNRIMEGKIKEDTQLWNAQARLTIRGEHGADRAIFFPINTDFDPTPQLRPNPFPNSLRGRDNAFRIDQSRVLGPRAVRNVSYSVPAKVFDGPGTWKVMARLRFRGIPPYFYEYFGLTRYIPYLNEGIVDVNGRTVDVVVEASK